MTATEIETAARRRLNAVSDSFWSEAEIFNYLYMAETELAMETQHIEKTDATTTSTASTAAYAIPTGFLNIERVDYNGTRLQKIDEREADSLTLGAQITPTGTPSKYTLFNETITLLPVPNTSSLVIKFWGKGMPTEIASGSGSSTPDSNVKYHWALVHGVTFYMVTKEVGHPRVPHFKDLWERAKLLVKKDVRKLRSRDRNPRVKREEDMMIARDFGIV